LPLFNSCRRFFAPEWVLIFPIYVLPPIGRVLSQICDFNLFIFCPLPALIIWSF